MRTKPEDVEYMIQDFLEIRFTANELENARVIRFLMNRIRPTGQFDLCPVYGFLIDGIVVCVVSTPERSSARELLLLNRKTGERIHYQQMHALERLTW